jgi:uncharacterized membrane protein
MVDEERHPARSPGPREPAGEITAAPPESRASNAALSIGLGLLGLLMGAGVGGNAWGAFSGLAIGLLGGVWHATTRRADTLAQALNILAWRMADLERPQSPAVDRDTAPASRPESAVTSPRSSEPATPKSPPQVDTPRSQAGAPRPEPPPTAPDATPPPAPAAQRSSTSTPPAPSTPDPLQGAVVFLREFFLGGNTVARVGILVLLVGVALLAKWAADHSLFPIEARLAGAASIGAALTAVGYSLRNSRPGFAATLQGGGVAALYLVVFTAFRLFGLVPAGMAFGLFIAIAAAAGVLAVLQRSQPLIVIGSLGGFLAPVLASTGAGNHVVLFSYYLLLNIAVAAVAWFRTWRSLNLLAFVCTYGVATAWGVLRYSAEDFATTQPFLLAFLVLFTAQALVFSWRRPPHLRGIVDGTLVFGTPLVTLLAQARLVEGMEFGLAYSAAGFGLFYAVTATWLWKTAPETLRRLTEAFAALAVGFGTMAIPFAFEDALTTAIAWSLEGAGIYWVGSRQWRRLARMTGIGLQLLAALAFAIGEATGPRPGDGAIAVAIVNGPFLSCLALAAAGFFIAREADLARSQLSHREWHLTQLLGGWALAWWAAGSCAEIIRFVPAPFEAVGVVALIAVTALALERGADVLGWAPGRPLALAALPAAAIAIPATLEHQLHLLAHGGALVWPFCLIAIYILLTRLERGGPSWLPRVYAPALWLLVVVTSVALAGLAAHGLHLQEDWRTAAFGLGLAVVASAALLGIEQEWGVFARHTGLQLGWGLGPVIGLALLWFGVANFTGTGDARPLPYLPLLNPVDVTLCMAGVLIASWWLAMRRAQPELLRQPETQKLAVAVLCGLAFLLLNGVLVRSVHQWTDVPFRARALWDSASLQVSFSIAWTLVALGGMWLSARRGWRPAWMGCAVLIAAVVLKLFTVDLAQLSPPAKIGTFLVVGVLLLLVGYISPVPPASRPDDRSDGSGEPDLTRETTIEARRRT